MEVALGRKEVVDRLEMKELCFNAHGMEDLLIKKARQNFICKPCWQSRLDPTGIV